MALGFKARNERDGGKRGRPNSPHLPNCPSRCLRAWPKKAVEKQGSPNGGNVPVRPGSVNGECVAANARYAVFLSGVILSGVILSHPEISRGVDPLTPITLRIGRTNPWLS